MPLARLLVSPDPVIPMAMARLLKAIDAHGQCCDPGVLAVRSAALACTVQRWLLATKGRNIHSDLRLAAALSDYERRWTNASEIARRFETFESESRQLMAMVDQRRTEAGPFRRRIAANSSHGFPAQPPLRTLALR